MSNFKQKSGIVELMRFLFAVVIVIYHFLRKLKIAHALGDVSYKFFNSGYIGVEFFFLLSGLLMAASISRQIQSTGPSRQLGTDTLQFVGKKYMRIFPYHVMAFVPLLIIRIVGKRIFDPVKLLAYIGKSIPSFFLIQKFGWSWKSVKVNGAEWYLSAMFIGMLVLYPLCRRYYDLFTRLIGPFGGLALLGLLYHKFGTFVGQERWFEFTMTCVLRAMAEMGIGCGLYEFSRSLSTWTVSEKQASRLTALEYFCFFCGLLYSALNIPSKYEIVAIGVMSVGLVLAFSGLTHDTRFNTDWAYRLGSYSMPMYLAQLIGIFSVVYFFDFLPYKAKVLLTAILVALATALVKRGGDRLLERNQAHVR